MVKNIYYGIATLLAMSHFMLYWAANHFDGQSQYVLGIGYQLSIKASLIAALAGIMLVLSTRKAGGMVRNLVLATVLASFGILDFMLRFLLQP